MAARCEGLVDDDPCLESGTHFLINCDHGPDGDDRLLAALERDCPDDPMLQAQVAGWFCGEHAGHILGHYPIMKEIEVPEFGETLPLGGAQPEALLDLARKGNEEAFKELARCLGVEKEQLDAMWTGTTLRALPPRQPRRI